MTITCSRLGVNQQYLIHYSDAALATWTNSAMEATLRLLTRAAQNFGQALLAGGQQLITDHFQPMVYDDEIS